MTTTIKSNTDGSSAIQTNGVDRIQFDTSGNTNINGALTASSFPIFTGSNQSLGSSGYQKLPGGLIIQWGQASSSISVDTTVTYPIPFPNGVLSLTATVNNGAGSTSSFASIGSTVGVATKTSFNFGVRTSNTAARISEAVSWLAIGY